MKGSQYFGNTLQAPRWAADFLNREHLEPWSAQRDPTPFTDSAGVPITVGASAIQGATSVTVSALTPSLFPATSIIATGNVLIPSGAVIDFGGAKFARLTADAKVGDTSLTVAALPTALAGTETAVYSPFGTETIPSGTIIGRTFAERTTGGALWGPAVITDDEIFIVAFDLPNAKLNNVASLYRHNSRVKENYLPNYTTLSTGANEVQTVAVDTILSGGKIGFTAVDKNGVPQTVVVAYNTSWTQTVADIQTALNALLGTSAVAAAVTNTHDMTLTFSGTNYAGVAQQPVGVDISAATGPTKVTVTRSTAGGTALLTKIRSLYQCILGVD
jgi:hypothetical protein